MFAGAPPRHRLTLGSPATNHRHGCSAAFVIPIRADWPGLRRRRGAVVGQPRPARQRRAPGRRRRRGPVSPSAWHSRAGPEHRSRSRRAAGRAARIASRPASGAPARSSTAWPSAGVAAHDVGAPVHPVREVHVEVARRPEHGGVAPGRAPVGVRCRVLGAGVGLDLHDAGPPLAHHQHLVEQQRGHDPAVVVVEGARQRPHGRRRSELMCAATHNPAKARQYAPGGARRARQPRRARSASSRWRNRSSWAATGSGPPPPGVVRRVTATPGATRAAASGPSRPSAATRSASGGAPGSSDARTSAPTTAWASRKGVPAGHQPLGQVGGRHRGRRRRRRHPRRCRTWPWRSSRPARRGPARPGRRRRTAAPCPPAGPGCTPAAGP